MNAEELTFVERLYAEIMELRKRNLELINKLNCLENKRACSGNPEKSLLEELKEEKEKVRNLENVVKIKCDFIRDMQVKEMEYLEKISSLEGKFEEYAENVHVDKWGLDMIVRVLKEKNTNLETKLKERESFVEILQKDILKLRENVQIKYWIISKKSVYTLDWKNEIVKMEKMEKNPGYPELTDFVITCGV